MNRALLPSLCALALVIAGPARERLEVTHGPKLIGLLLLAAALMWTGRVPLRQWKAGEWLAVAVLAMAAVSGAMAESPALALAPLGLGFGAVAIALGVSARDDREVWLEWIAIAAVAVAVIGAVELVGFIELAPRGKAPSATMGQRNALAHFLLLASSVVWQRALTARRWLFATALIAAVIVATRSRAAWVVGPPVLLLFVVLTRRVAALKLVAVAALGAGIAAIAPVELHWRQAHPYSDTLARLIEWRSGSGWSRLVEWSGSLELWKSDPLLGIGPGNWFAQYGLLHEGGRFPHSDHVAVLVERGIVGAVLWIALAVVVGARSRDPVVVCALVAAAALGALDSVLQLPAPLLLLTVIAFAGTRSDVTPARAPIAAAGLGVLAVAACLAFTSQLLSTAESTPFDRLELAAALDPFEGEVRVTLAEAWASAGDCAKAPGAARHRRAVCGYGPRPALTVRIDPVELELRRPAERGLDHCAQRRLERAAQLQRSALLLNRCSERPPLNDYLGMERFTRESLSMNEPCAWATATSSTTPRPLSRWVLKRPTSVPAA